jgi:hypothetical protein
MSMLKPREDKPFDDPQPGTAAAIAQGCSCVLEEWGWKETGCPVHSWFTRNRILLNQPLRPQVGGNSQPIEGQEAVMAPPERKAKEPEVKARRLGGGDLRFFDAIAQEWELTFNEQVGLLRVSEPTLAVWREAAHAGQDVAVDDATLERLGQLVAIFKELGVLLPSSHAGWVRRPSSNPLFGGGTALTLMLTDPEGIAIVLGHLRGWHGGWCG